MPRRLAPLAVAFALWSLPVAVQAQTIPARTAEPSEFTVRVSLTLPGVHVATSDVLREGLSAVDTQSIDVDGDGDLDQLVLVDVNEDETPKPDLGRGVVVMYRETAGWRGETVASLPMYPREAGFNWGTPERSMPGVAPVLRLHFSSAGPSGVRQAEVRMRFEQGSVRQYLPTQNAIALRAHRR